MNERQAGVELLLTVLPQSSIFLRLSANNVPLRLATSTVVTARCEIFLPAL